MDAKELLLTTCMSIQQFSACLWDYRSSNAIQYYRNGGRVASKGIAILNQDQLIAADAERPLLNVWPLNSQEPMKNSKLVLPGQANCMALCPRNTYLAIAVGAKLYIWHLSSGKLLTVQEKHYQAISAIKFSNDSVYLAVGGSDGTLVTYNFPDLVCFENNLYTQSRAGQVETLYSRSDHTRDITDMCIGVFGGKSRLVTVSADSSCILYNLASGEILTKLNFPEHLTCVVLDNTFCQLYVGTQSGCIYQRNLTTPSKDLNCHVDESDDLKFSAHEQKITCLAINLNCTILASGSTDSSVHIWKVESMKRLRSIEHKGVITNLLFTLNHDNILNHLYKPSSIIVKLERTFDQSDQLLEVSVNQDYDLDIDDSIMEKNKIEMLVKENRYLRATNKQLYGGNIITLNKRKLDS